MNKNLIQKMLDLLPEGRKKERLISKYKRVLESKNGGESGLQDSFELEPKGHIKIEEIDSSGKVLGVLADKSNLVVNGAEEILLRSFSGDPNRILFKNRLPKQDETEIFFIEEGKLSGENLFDGDQLLHSPNVLWSAVDDSKFDVGYGYFPITVYIKEETSTEYGKKAFRIYKDAVPGSVPLSAEIYSTYTNMFIGIGEGKHYKLNMNDPRLIFSEGFSPSEDAAQTSVEKHEVKYIGKISRFALDYEATNKGAKIEIYVNGSLRDTVDSLDESLSNPITKSIEYDGFDNTVETEIKIVHAGTNSDIEKPEMTLKALYVDELTKDMNGLIKEFKNFESEFLTPAVYNTTPMGPYTIQLPNFPVKKGSVEIKYNELIFTEVDSPDKLTDNTFYLDDLHGVIEFNRALAGVNITYSITGEIYDTELPDTMTATNVSYVTASDLKQSETPVGVVNGLNKTFTLTKKNIKKDTVIIKKSGIELDESDISQIDYSTGEVVLEVAPNSGETITAEYVYVHEETTTIDANKYTTPYEIKEGTLRLFDQNGEELQRAENKQDFGDGKYMLVEGNKRAVLISLKNKDSESITRIEAIYKSDEKPGVPTNYSRAVIEKPKTVNEYPWFELDKGAVRFVAEFPELKPSHNVTIREMGLFDGPRMDDKIAGFNNYPVKAFSLVRVGETRKDVNTGIRITWTITLLNEEGKPFQGGNN
ncbi:hypothetical protein B14_200223 (plasmid) [Bacillus licheniformis]|uniref:hypothetical protein n=1 Tax=Bacillus licheniformis TaxID=1402 RepID=UPI0009B7D45E|nr:hypothetical protein [Bacillus licheniformis]ARC67434.1 hypothetical protein B14_200223 [Bacillus licheniformis]ARW46157.1 hypothetical protein S100141_04939 [Bacillus licheniformis]MDE1421864.1 hypothetical protein [Bacillus licheniformis]MEC0475869.1 hypothetical protein [Bacillus licheniformis]RHL11929.1 hypothetical protein DW032_20075 [Bacillus licheniformis]